MRWPTAPVLPLIEGVEDAVVAEVAGVDRRTVVRWRSGVSTALNGDTTADRLGVWLVGHPALLWESWDSDLTR